MSLLADLLSKIKQPQPTREVPPNLQNIVNSAASKSATRKKFIVLSGLFFLCVLTGFVIVYLVNTVSDTSDTGITPQQHAANDYQLSGNQSGQGKDNNSRIAAQIEIQKKAVTPADPVNVKTKKRLTKKQKPHLTASEPAPMTSAGKTEKSAPVAAVKETKTIDAAARDALLYKAREFEMRQDYSSALGTYKEALQIDNKNVMVLNSIAYTYLKLGFVQESIQFALMAEEQDVDYTPALINLGIANAKSGNASAAEYYLDRAFSLEPDNKQAIFNLALMHEKKQNYAGAADFYSKLIKLGDISGSLGLARTYEKQGRKKEAIKLYRSAALRESLEQNKKRQIRQKIMILQNEIIESEDVRQTLPATDVTQ